MSRPIIGVIGAGPAGIMAALEASRLGAKVTLFDTNAMVGRKLLITGNGRCNISNLNAHASAYVCADRAWLDRALCAITPSFLLDRLRHLCIPTYATPDGWCYPLSNSAATVVDALDAALRLAGIELRLQCKIADIISRRQAFVLHVGGPSETARFDRIVVATGGKAYPALGSRGTLLPALERLGHTIVPVYPALVPIRADVRRLTKLQGVRLDAALRMIAGDVVLGDTVGNVMFAKDGLSGPAAMDLSYIVHRQRGRRLVCEIDLLHGQGPTVDALVQENRRRALPLTVLLGSVLPPKLPPVLLDLAALDRSAMLADTREAELARLLKVTRHLRVRVTGTRDLKQAQLSSGGVPVNEVAAQTMVSRRVSGLYLAGEVLDVIGPCGGYNLHFALASGILAGRSAAAD